MAALAIQVLSTSFVVPLASHWCSPAPLPVVRASPCMSLDGMGAEKAVDSGSSTADFVGGKKAQGNKWNTEHRGVVVNLGAVTKPTAAYISEAPDKVDANSITAAFLAKSEQELFLRDPPEKPEPEPEPDSSSSTVVVGGGRADFFKGASAPPAAPKKRAVPTPPPPPPPPRAAPEPEPKSDAPTVVVGGGRADFFKAASAPPTAPKKRAVPTPPPPPPAAPVAKAPPAPAPKVPAPRAPAPAAPARKPPAPTYTSPAAAASSYAKPLRRNTLAGMDANWAVDANSDTSSFAFNAETARGPSQVNAEKWARAQERAVKIKLQAAVTAAAAPKPPADVVARPQRAAPAARLGMDAQSTVDSSSSLAAFALNAEPAKGSLASSKRDRELRLTPRGVSVPSVGTPPVTPTLERISALERLLLGAEASPQGPAPFQRIEWLDTQLGATSGTMVQRLDALEVAAKAQGFM